MFLGGDDTMPGLPFWDRLAPGARMHRRLCTCLTIAPRHMPVVAVRCPKRKVVIPQLMHLLASNRLNGTTSYWDDMTAPRIRTQQRYAVVPDGRWSSTMKRYLFC